MNPTIPAMYGQSNEESSVSTKLTEATDEFEIKTQARNFASIKVGKESVTVPKAEYVKQLEDRVERLESGLKASQSANRQLRQALTAMTKDISSLRKELDGKLDRFN